MYDQLLGVSIIENLDGVEKVVYASIFDPLFDFDQDGNYHFLFSASTINYNPAGTYYLQFWTTADVNHTFACIISEAYPGHYASFGFDLSYYTPPAAPANDDCANTQVIIPTTEAECTQMESGRFLAATAEAQHSGLECQNETRDVWYSFTATSTQYELQTASLDEVGWYYIQLLEGNDCTNFSPLSCDFIQSSDTLQYTDLQIGQTYHLRFIESYFSDIGAFEFCLRNLQSTCLFPDVTVDPVCLNNEFYQLEITVTDMHGNSQLTIHDQTNEPPLSNLVITMPGVYHYAQIDTSMNFSIQVSADETACNLSFTDFVVDCIAEPPVNDLCMTAAALQLGNSSCYTGFNTTASNSHGGCNNDHVDVWFSFQAQSRSHYLSLTVIDDSSIGMEVFTGDCNNLNSVYCDSGSGHWLNELIEGQTYYVVLDFPSSAVFYTLCNNSFSSADNDNCPESITLPILSNCDAQNFTNAGATAQLIPLACTADNSDDVWFDFIATTPDISIRIDNIAPLLPVFVGDLVASLYTGDCNALIERGCTTFTSAVSEYSLDNLIPGEHYYLRVSASSFDEYFNFSICLVGMEPPANDDCTDALILPINPGIVCSQSLDGTTTAAIGFADADCDGNEIQDVWYKFTAASTEYVILLNSEAGGIAAKIYTDACNNLINFGDCVSSSPINLTGLTINQEYFIQVYSTAGFGVDFEICMLSVPPPPANDECDGAYSLNIGSELCDQTTAATFLSSTGFANDCNAQGISRDLWFSFTATANNLNLSVVNVIDPFTGQNNDFASIGYEYYDGNCNALLSLGCVNDMAFNNMPMTGLVQGNSYFVRVFIDNFSQDVSFNVCLSDDQAPANDELANAITLIQEPANNCTPMTLGTFAHATSSLAANSCNAMTGTANDDVWFRFVASSTQPTINVDYLMGAFVIELFDDDGTTFLDCANDASFTPTVNIGETYYLRIYTTDPFPLEGEQARFTICINGVPTLTISNANNAIDPDICVVVNQQIISAASERWLHIQHQGDMVASIFDSEALGVINTSFFIHPGTIRSSMGIEYLNRNFTITPTIQPSGYILLRLYFTQTELNAIINANDNDNNDINNINDLVVSRFNGANCSNNVNANNGILYTTLNSGSFGAGGFYIDIRIDQFSSFFIHGGSQVLLPVEMGVFEAQSHEKGIHLQWETFSESNNAGFELERSVDGRHFTDIKWIKGAGNSSNTKKYAFLDVDVTANNRYYYRLKQVDFTGAIIYTNPISALWNRQLDNDLTIYPNPASEQLNIVWQKVGSIQKIEIFDLQGKKWQTRVVDPAKSSVQLSTSDWPTGLYFVFGIDRFGQRVSEKKLSVIHL